MTEAALTMGTDLALTTLANKVMDLERENQLLRDELQAVQARTFEAQLGVLRLHKIALVWASRDYSLERKEWTASTLRGKFGNELWQDCVRHMFDLHAIVNSPAIEQQIANAFEDGNGKFDT